MHLLAALCCSMRHNSGFSILLKDTSACRYFLGRLENLQVGGRPLYPLSHSRPAQCNTPACLCLRPAECLTLSPPHCCQSQVKIISSSLVFRCRGVLWSLVGLNLWLKQKAIEKGSNKHPHTSLNRVAVCHIVVLFLQPLLTLQYALGPVHNLT